MATAFLCLIYILFISLGLPDSLLGAAWPVMRPEIGASVDFAGLVFMCIQIGTITSAIFASHLIKRVGTAKITLVSVFLTAASMLGFGLAKSPWTLMILALPYGLGAGAIDSGLNEYVAEHYESRHMSWLHSFWGVGAMTGPILLSILLTLGSGWRTAYVVIASVQFFLSAIVFLSLPLWDKMALRNTERALAKEFEDRPAEANDRRPLYRRKGFFGTLLSMFCYCSVEQSYILWGATYLIAAFRFTPAEAAGWVSFYVTGITLGRFFSGFLSMRFTNSELIRFGSLTVVAATIGVILPLPVPVRVGCFLLAGFGSAPIFPCILHDTPLRFGVHDAQEVMGYQMAAAYIGSLLVPPLIGLIATKLSQLLIPAAILTIGLMLLIATERIAISRSARRPGP